METNTILIVCTAAILGLVLGLVVSKLREKNKASQVTKNAKRDANSIISKARIDGEATKKDKIFQAKERFLELKSEHEQVIQSREKKISEVEKRTRDKESQISSELSRNKKLSEELESKINDYDQRSTLLGKRKEEVEKAHKSQIKQLEVISGLSADDAKQELVESLKSEAKNDAMVYIQDTMEEAKLTAEQDAKKIIINTIQRIGTEEAVDNCVSVFNIESDDVKGRIIGREGRNIRAIEAATGVEIIVDDTPEAIILSCFDSVRREVARLSLHKLVTDGRIHPARIEEIVKKTQKQIEQEIIEVGKRTVIDLGIHGLHPELIKMVGRMKYRSSYGQNLLQHSREVANFCATMAAELGLNVKLAKRAGLLHDIGKVPDDNPELPHALLGMQLAEKYKEHPEVCNAIGAHHDEIEMTSMISPIIQACDAISGARPVTAIVNADNSGDGVLHVKSLLPPTATEDSTAATIGSVDVIFSAKTGEAILGEKLNSVTNPAVTVLELRPTGINTPSAESSSTVIFASTSPGVKTLRTLVDPVLCPGFFF